MAPLTRNFTPRKASAAFTLKVHIRTNAFQYLPKVHVGGCSKTAGLLSCFRVLVNAPVVGSNFLLHSLCELVFVQFLSEI